MITNDAIPEGRFATKLRQQDVFLDILRTDLWILSLLSISMGTCGRLACPRRSDSRAREKNSRRKKKPVETRGKGGENVLSL